MNAPNQVAPAQLQQPQHQAQAGPTHPAFTLVPGQNGHVLDWTNEVQTKQH